MGSNIFLGTSLGIYFSNTLGESWEKLSDSTISDHSVSALAIKNSKIFALSPDGFTFASFDTGKTWLEVTNQFPLKSQYPKNYFVNSLDVIDTNLYACTQSGCFVSSNDGLEWSEMIIDTTKPGSNFAVFKIFKYNSILFVGTKQGLYLSSDNGNNWTNFRWGFDTYLISTTFGALGDVIYAATPSGLYISKNFGRGWRARFLPTIHSTIDWLICYHTVLTKAKNIFAVGQVYNCIFRSTDDGISWEWVGDGISSPIINKLASIGNYILAAGSKGIYYSLTDGENWSMANGIDSWVKDLFVFGNLVFAGAFDGMYKSSDSGKTWQLITNGLPLDQPIWSITSIGSTLFALHRSLGTNIISLFMSTDTGKTWLPIESNPPLPYLTYSILAIDSILFAKTDIPKYNLIVSTDCGKTWAPAEFPGQGFAIYNSILYSINGYGIAYSTDCGITWEELKEENLRYICSIAGFSEDKIFLIFTQKH